MGTDKYYRRMPPWRCCSRFRVFVPCYEMQARLYAKHTTASFLSIPLALPPALPPARALLFRRARSLAVLYAKQMYHITRAPRAALQARS